MIVRISYPPMSFLVMPVFGSKIRNNHHICGKNVATLNACLMFSVVRMPADRSREEERAAEFVIKVLAVSKSSSDRESADCCVFL